MKDNNKVFWKGVEELGNSPEFVKNAQNEFPEFLPLKNSSEESNGTDRRDFLKLLGFSVAAVSLAACEAPVKKAIPYLNKPEEIEPGIANYYASTFVDGGEYCSVLVKTREGRPIKIEGNKLSSVTKGGTNGRVQASVLSLYDTARIQGPLIKGAAATWADLDKQVGVQLGAIAATGGNIRIVSPTILSPTTKKAIAAFKAKYPSTEHVQYDANSSYGILKANQTSFGQAVIPSYDFSKAEVIVGFGADFLGTWISPIEFVSQYADTRRLSKTKKTMSQHFQFETALSLTGSNADYRQPIKPSQEGLFIAELYNKIVSSKVSTTPVKNDVLDKAAAALLKASNRGKSLVVSGSNDVNVQILVNEINLALGNYGTTISLATPSFQKQGNDEAMNTFINDAVAGKVNAVIFYGSNPVFDHARGAELAKALSSVSLTVSFADRVDETAALTKFVAPDHHYLEAWGDAEPRAGFYSLGQPSISPIFKTRAAQESLLLWSGNSGDYYEFLKSNWISSILGGASWDQALQDGVFEPKNKSGVEVTASSFDRSAVEAGIIKNYPANTSGIELKLYEKIGLGTGSQANNPWLQELPDPISKATWDNYVAVSASYAKANALEQGDRVAVKSANYSVELPVLIQPGQAGNTVSIAIGYGRTHVGKCGDGVGKNVYPFARFVDGSVLDFVTGVSVTKLGGDKYPIAQTQTHHTLMARPIIQDALLSEYINDPSAGRFKPTVSTPDGKKAPALVDIWKDQHHQPNHLWSMSIDLNTCLGCGACVIACQAENNVPVVGKKEVLNAREMHWIRIDRYYSSDAEPTKTGEYFTSDAEGIGYGTLEIPSENPQVTFQPMMCQHCNHAPCETVCPVAATTHSSEGLNQMTYNRCIGTRYCANNCPYKVRRFNWFKYFDNEEKFDKNVAMNTSLGRMVLNPDVTVRSRGVMEKCSFCVQKIQEGKLKAKKEKRHIVDGEVTTACAAACATGAILFGDLRDVEGKVYQERNVHNPERTYTVLEELNVQPNITYLTKIRNISKA
ncbi:TAT-variant-translocated molybdopterin oxidoreductase [Cytophaga hutchinsonii]|jgi:MoCo/4Fe-4S cofactor protein with predicted Tat translocation signal|uniref:Quinol:cytochrome c oxidoreductase iron-sulfur protein n=1 Tax=Cytophaga hutchinsonii (strain ATCC 33406 / DSM 1761 / CIP 103989 / NBRC 15051 / NCIMB 9469 / D465) TaxID=269798 RepID=A0A6N4SSS7_CYTH3|nr:TAT-variant-translocated molybdopterin oxidoreductase [Cytophaga hutchinsonii]ABG59475.1 quinol:cytochrome c oxidoreductase iron-sulfur protein precursor [Cytophaga hutchinsonii ATCC 33406]SFX96740.1 quinol:cytochrome c oxidoreductase iron-sulfur protein precursor [Cytophaga hutchinsonii ATCC 33406]